MSIAVGLGLVPKPAAAQSCPEGTVAEIVIERRKPFERKASDPQTTFRWAYRWLDAVHVRTRVGTILRELHFSEGDCFDPFVLEESARTLRATPFIADVSASVERRADGARRVRLEVDDAWALTAGVALSVDEGLRVTGVTADAGNVLGTGTRLGLYRTRFRERRRAGLIGRQPNLFGSRIDATIHGGETRSGGYVHGSVSRPFPGELGRWAFRQVGSRRDDYFAYSTGADAPWTHALLRFEEERWELSVQRRFGSSEGTRAVVGLGLSREELRFPHGQGTVTGVADARFDDPGAASPALAAPVLPQVRPLRIDRAHLTLGLRSVRFRPRQRIDGVRGSQDVPFGAHLLVSVGPSLGGQFGNDLLLRAQGSWVRGEGRLLVGLEGDLQARRVDDALPDGAWRDLVYDASARGYWLQGGNTQLFGRIRYTAGYATERPFQLTVGGREAVRAFDDDAFPAARRLLATLEQRVTLPRLGSFLDDVGAGVFLDAGRGWAGSVPFGTDSGWRTGGGVGLRIGLPPGSTNVLRVDVGRGFGASGGARRVTFRIHMELTGLLDRRSWPRQMDRSRWYGVDPDLSRRVRDPLARN